MESAHSGTEELSTWQRWRRFDRMLLLYAVLAFVLLALTLAAFDWLEGMHEQYRHYERIRFDTTTLLEAQIDEESGIRGYEATLQAPLLQQYYRHAGLLTGSIGSLAARMTEPLGAAALADFARRHDQWKRLVAAPAIARAGRGDVARERAGQRLVDGMQRDAGVIDRLYERLERETLQRARILTVVCAAGIVAVVTLVALLAFVSERASARREEGLLAAVIDKRDTATRIGDWRAKVVAMLAHDFKSTLAVIKGYVHLLHDFPERRDDPTAYREIDKAVAELAYMADDALLMARMSGSSFEIAREPLQISEILEEIAKRYQDRRPITLLIDGGASVSGDRFYLLRLFDNLVSNAVKYSPETSPVTVRLAHNGQHEVQIAVTDQGKGIGPGDLPHIFEEYWRSPAAAAGTGTGVGLFIVKKIVESHGGSVSVESKLGEGTTVRVTLREVPPAAPASASA